MLHKHSELLWHPEMIPEHDFHLLHQLPVPQSMYFSLLPKTIDLIRLSRLSFGFLDNCSDTVIAPVNSAISITRFVISYVIVNGDNNDSDTYSPPTINLKQFF